MRYLVFTNTPAHVHLYRNAVTELCDRGHDVLVLARDYGCTVDLLEYYGLPHEVYGRCETTKFSLVRRLPGHYARIVRAARSFDPDLIFGMGAYAAHAGAVTRTRTVLVLDSEPTSVDHLISRPFADALVTPAAFRKDLGANHFVFAGFKETAYLHPEVVETDPGIRDALGVGDDPYVICRFNAFGSHHDVGQSGFSPTERERLIDALAESATVLVSDEGGEMDFDSLPARPFDVHPALMHDALAAAALVVADTQTIATEAALLGTPTIRSNSFVGDDDMGNFVELGEAGLLENVRDTDAVLDRATEILADPTAGARWQRRRAEYLAGTENLSALLVAVATDPGDLDGIDGLRRRSRSEESHGRSATGVGAEP